MYWSTITCENGNGRWIVLSTNISGSFTVWVGSLVEISLKIRVPQFISNGGDVGGDIEINGTILVLTKKMVERVV